MPFPILVRSASCLLAFALCDALHGQVTTRTDTVGKLLNEWHAAGTAGGLSAITYENRDGGHSPLNEKEWPQLQIVPATQRTTGPGGQVRSFPLLGNCSMAGPPTRAGSVPRLYMAQQQGWDFLARQYSSNNHFIYPEHQDYDAGWNGRGGWGDLFPANTPCVTICQGSSYLDQPFLRAFLSATAAFPPATQQLILEKKLLAPTLQMILRRCYKAPGAKTEQDYFTGKLHPVVFDGALIDEEKMVRLAHDMTPEMIPPVVVLQVVGESQATPGQHFFEADDVKNEVLGSSPCAIGRIFRGSLQTHEMFLSAQQSLDVKSRPLKFRWVLLQGDPNRVRINVDGDGSLARLVVSWHPEVRLPGGIQTHRVDVGVFASNGASWSPPSIVSFYMLPNEARFYDFKGRIEEVCYDAANPDPGLPPVTDLRWMALGWRLGKEQKDPGVALLTHHMSEIAIVRLQGLTAKLGNEQDAWRKLSLDESKKKEADKALSALQVKLRKGMEETFDNTGRTLAQAFEDGVRSVASVSDLYLAGQDVIPDLVKNSGKPDAVNQFAAARQRLVNLGIFKPETPEFTKPLVKLDALTAAEKHHLYQFHLTVLNLALLPEILDRVEGPAFVDSRLTAPKPWRDVYHYGDDGKCAGWTRHMEGRTYEFDAEGRLFPLDRTGTPIAVKYSREGKSGKLDFEPKGK